MYPRNAYYRTIITRSPTGPRRGQRSRVPRERTVCTLHIGRYDARVMGYTHRRGLHKYIVHDTHKYII